MGRGADHRAIVRVLDRYAEAIDLRRWSLLDEVFTADVEYDFGLWSARTRDDVVAAIRSFLDDCGPTQHLLGNYRVELDGDQARSSVYVRAFHVGVGAAKGQTYEMGGEYHDELRRTADGWRSFRRRGVVIFEQGSRAVLGAGRRGSRG